MQAEYPDEIIEFGTDLIDGDYLHAEHINSLRAEITAIESALGIALANTLSAGFLQAAGDLITASAPGALTRLPIGADGQILSADSGQIAGLKWSNLTDPFLPRVSSLASAATPAPPAGECEQFNLTALAENAAFASPTGGVLDGKRLLLRIRDNGIARGLTWNSVYVGVGVTLPSVTIPNKLTYIGLVYNAQTARWEALAVATEA